VAAMAANGSCYLEIPSWLSRRGAVQAA